MFQELWSGGNQEEVIGAVKFGHQFVNMSSQKVDYQLPNGTVIQVSTKMSFIRYKKICDARTGKTKTSPVRSYKSYTDAKGGCIKWGERKCVADPIAFSLPQKGVWFKKRNGFGLREIPQGKM